LSRASGYSGTPLPKKLGIGENHVVWAVHAPKDYPRLVAPLPPGVRIVTRQSPDTDLVHVFVSRRDVLQADLNVLRANLRPEVPIWVSWPKKSSKVSTDITEDTVREVALPLGYVDVKVCAVDEVWSGLKLVVRKELRSKGGR
jgi:hypothetical protein